MTSRVRVSLPDPDATDPERPPPALPSHLLEEILLRVSSPADLARAATACVSFRRIIADQAFLRRYRSIHPPLLLGFVSYFGFHPAEAPHPSAAVARSVDFSFNYFPSTKRWLPCDVHDGRVLLEGHCVVGRSELLVCDLLLSRRYLLLPPITDDLLASFGIQDHDMFSILKASFIRSGGTEEDTSFSVISWMQSSSSSSRFWVFIFSSGSGCWSIGNSWGNLGSDEIGWLTSSHWAYNCIYWKLNNMSTLVKLDMNSMQFCTVDLPPGHDKRKIAIVESGESRVAMFSMINHGTSVDYYTFSQNGSEKSHEWHLKSTIPLPAGYTYKGNFGGAAEGYIFIECNPDETVRTYLTSCPTDSAVFSLEIKSFNIERVGRTSYTAFGPYPCFGFSPSISPRRI